MGNLGLIVALVFVSGAGGSVSASSRQKPHTNPQAQILQEFQDRVKDYVKLRDAATKELPEPKETKNPDEIRAAQDAAAARIRAARRDARQGEIFTPEIARHIRGLMQPEMEGRHGAETRGAIKDVQPGAVRLTVNARYPDDQPTPMVPPNVLASLPRLPEGLEYRVVRNALVLLDTKAAIIVDFIPNVMR